MTSPPANDRLEIEVQDFGPIVHAKLDLRPMTVFVGPSNTGKSYLAVLIYALHRSFSARHGIPGLGRLGPWRSSFESSIPEPTKEAIAAFERLDKCGIDVGRDPESGDKDIRIEFPEEVIKLLRSDLGRLAGAIGEEILRCFGSNKVSTLVRKGRTERSLVMIRSGYSGAQTLLEHVLSFDEQGAEFQAAVPKRIYTRSADFDRTGLHCFLQEIQQDWGQSNSSDWNAAFMDLMVALRRILLSSIVGHFDLRSFYLPADRTGVMHAHNAIVSAMLDNVPMAGLRPAMRTPMLSGVLADFLRDMIQVDNQWPHWPDEMPHEDARDVSRQIEQNILRGAVGVERSELINYPHFTYHPSGWKEALPLMHASSMVSDLAPIVLYLRHLVRPGNVLIIEEPESHLHPAMQVELTRQLAKLVQAGYRVIITTHSEWILEELANVVQRSQLPPEELAIVSESDAALTADQVGVWLFRQKRRPRGSEVVHVSLGESGLYDAGFDDVAIALSNDGAKIFNRIGQTE